MRLARVRVKLKAARFEVAKYAEVIRLANAEYGRSFRTKREGFRLSLREVARDMGISAPHLSDLEHGRRNWTEARMGYALRPAAKKRAGAKGKA